MDLPQPPEDEEARNIIDRLATFVARNGPGFEEMTKQKQQGNPRFEFLWGGPYYNYYTYRVTTEQAILKQHAMRQQQQQFQQQHQQLQQIQGQSRYPPQPQQIQGYEYGPGGPGLGHGPGPSPGPPGGLGQGARGGQFDPRPHQFQSQQQQQHFQQQQQQQPYMPPSHFQGAGPGPHQFHPSTPPSGPPSSRFSTGPGPPGTIPQQQYQVGAPSPSFSPGPPISRGFSSGPPPPGAGPGPGHQFLVSSSAPSIPPPPRPNLPPVVPLPPPSLESLLTQKKSLQDSITQSEQNLRSQHQVLLTQQGVQIEDALRKSIDQEIQTLATEIGITSHDLSIFDTILDGIMETCKKDAIANGKAWILTHSSTRKHYEFINCYLLRRVTDPKLNFNQRLPLIYLANDTVHHCQRKGATDLQEALLTGAIVPMFSFTKVAEESQSSGSGANENLNKLDKLLTLWEKICLSSDTMDKLRNYQTTWTEFKNQQIARHSGAVGSVMASIQKTFEGFQNQHNLFLAHVSEGIKGIDRQIAEAIEYQKSEEERRQILQKQEEVIRQMQIAQQTQIDLSRPPPGLGLPPPLPPPPPPALEIPKLPYYELPAGLMVPLIKLEDDNYKPLDPADIRLPAPCPPTERLIAALESFYSTPSHDNPRDAEGWEKLGLYEFNKLKNKARKDKEDAIREGRREKSKSPSPIIREDSPSGRDRGIGRRRYSSTSPSPPSTPRERDRADRDRDRRRGRSRSRSRSPPSRRRRRSRSRSPVNVSSSRRSPTPPSFGRSGFGSEPKLDESNKGHQLLKKMGWGGMGGLGANEQGIDAPISGGQLRDRSDQFKGVGVDLKDPFELYRKTKRYAFIERMRSRGGPEEK